MKTQFTFLFFLVICTIASAQSPINVPSGRPKLYSKEIRAVTQPVVETNIPTVSTPIVSNDDHKLLLSAAAGTTTYEPQNNSAMSRRIYNNNGNIGIAWTFSAWNGSGIPDRGSGYNYFTGTNWGSFPTARITSAVRSGFVSMDNAGSIAEYIRL